ERRVGLMAGEDGVVEVWGGDVDAAVGGQLRGVHHNPGTVFVCKCCEFGDRQDFTGHVRAPGGRQQRYGALAEFLAELGQGSGQCRSSYDTAVRDALPGKEIGMVLDVQVKDLARWLSA